MPTRRSSKEDREGGRKSAGCSISSSGHKAGSRRFGEMVAQASSDPGEQSPLLPLKRAKGSGMGGMLPPQLAKPPKRAPHKPQPRQQHQGLQCRGPSSSHWQPAGCSPHPLPLHEIPFCFLLRLKKLGAVEGGEHTAFPTLLCSLPTQLLPPCL